ncbi:MAG: hypothetical protein LBS82_00545, partial [Spirochaetaceae bacterium]|nr:hypothetical protein [Spirochaetaceae bacterium]
MRQYFCIFALLCGALGPALFAVGENHLAVGGKTGWGAVEAFDNIVELGGVRPAPVLSISSARGGRGERLDMYLSFDEG